MKRCKYAARGAFTVVWPFGSAGTSGLRGKGFIKLHVAVQVAVAHVAFHILCLYSSKKKKRCIKRAPRVAGKLSFTHQVSFATF